MPKIRYAFALFMTDVFYLFCRFNSNGIIFGFYRGLASPNISTSSFGLEFTRRIWATWTQPFDSLEKWTDDPGRYRDNLVPIVEMSGLCYPVQMCCWKFAFSSSSNRILVLVESIVNGWWFHFTVEQDLISVFFLGVCGLVYLEQIVHRFWISPTTWLNSKFCLPHFQFSGVLPGCVNGDVDGQWTEQPFSLIIWRDRQPVEFECRDTSSALSYWYVQFTFWFSPVCVETILIFLIRK